MYTSRNRTSPVLGTLVALGTYNDRACTIKAIDHVYGLHSTAGIWAAYIGLPGIAVGGFLNYLTGSEVALYLGAFVGNWLFCFCLFKVVLILRNRFG